MSIKPFNVSFVIPMYNEENAVTPVLDKVSESLSTLKESGKLNDFEIIVVDDGSSDNSVNMCQAHHTNPTILVHDINRGYGAALKTGFAHAQNEWISFLDMDATYNPHDFTHFFDEIESHGYQMIVGNRLSKTSGMPLIRSLGNNFFVFVTSTLFGVRIFDPCSGMRTFHSSFKNSFIELLPDTLDFALGMTLLLNRLKVSYKEIPINYDRRIGISKLSEFSDGLRFLRTILKIKFSNKANLLGRQKGSTAI
jgi:glycosyltransferase involved in cell wall biosynthesis